MQMRWIRNFAATLTVCALSWAASNTTWAQSPPYPARPIKLIVGSPPGQSGDAVARLVAQKMGLALNQSVFVENKPGAGAIIGSSALKESKPDGYTIMYGSTGSLVINPALYEKLPYDPFKDFVAIGLVNSAPQLLVVPNALPVKNLAEFIEYEKSRPSSGNFGSAGIGFANHLTMEMLLQRIGVKMVHVPYAGDAAALSGLFAGDIDAIFLTTTVAVPLIKAGKVKALAVSTRVRPAVAPDVPTVSESGFDGFDVVSWGSLMAPAGTPAPVLEQLNAALQKALDDADVKTQLATMGLTALKASTADTTAYIARQRVEWAAAVKSSGARLP